MNAYPGWGSIGEPVPQRFTMVDDLQRDKDEQPSAKLKRRIDGLARRKRMAELIGAFTVCTHIGGEPVAKGLDGRLRTVIWSARRILVVKGVLTADEVQAFERKHIATVVVVPPGADSLAVLEERFATTS